MFDEDDELNLFYDEDGNEDREWGNNYKEEQQEILPSQQDNNVKDGDDDVGDDVNDGSDENVNNVKDEGVNNVNNNNVNAKDDVNDDDVINLDDDDDNERKPHPQRQYKNNKKINRNVNTNIRSQRVIAPKHHNDNDNDNDDDSDCVIEIDKSEMTKHLEAKYENECKIKKLTEDETRQLANERVKHKNDQAMIREAKRKKYKTIPSNMRFNTFTGKFEQIKTKFDEDIEKEFQESKYSIPQQQNTTNTVNNVNTSNNTKPIITEILQQHQQQHKRNYNHNQKYNYKTHYNNNKDETNSTLDKSSHCSLMKFLNKKHNNNKYNATHSDYSFSDNEYKTNNNTHTNTNTVNRSYNNHNHNNYNHNNHNNHKQYIPKDNNNINNNNNTSYYTINMTQLKYDIINQIYTKDPHCRKDLMILFKQIKHYLHNPSTFTHSYPSPLHSYLPTPSHLDHLYSLGTFLYKTLCHHLLTTPHTTLSLTHNTFWRASDIPPIINHITSLPKP